MYLKLYGLKQESFWIKKHKDDFILDYNKKLYKLCREFQNE
jgi:hypothetical protein